MGARVIFNPCVSFTQRSVYMLPLSLLLETSFQFLNFFLAVLRIKPRVPYILWILLFSFHPTKTTNNTLARRIVQ